MAENVTVNVDTAPVAREINKLISHVNDVDRSVKGVDRSVGEVKDSVEGLRSEVKFVVVPAIAAVGVAVVAVRQEVIRGIEADAQSRVLDIVGRVRASTGLMLMAYRRIEQHFRSTVKRLGGITRRYDRFNADVVMSYQTDIRRLGKYAFELRDRHFNATVRDRVGDQHHGFMHGLRCAIESHRGYREKTLSGKFADAAQRLDDFLTTRKTFSDRIDAIRLPQAQMAAGPLNIPVVLAGKAGAEEVLAGRQISPGGAKSRLMTASHEAEGPLGSLVAAHASLPGAVSWRERTVEEQARLIAAIGRIQARGIISEEYRELLQGMVGRRAPRCIAGLSRHPMDAS